jgi:hypothetical protein
MTPQIPQAPKALPLKDIKPIVEVPDHSLWLFAGIVAAGVIAVLLLILWGVRLRRKRIDRRRAEALRRLNAIDWNDTKQAVYDFSFLGQFVVSDKTRAQFEALQEALEPYKYRKTVPELPQELKTKMQTFIKEARRG